MKTVKNVATQVAKFGRIAFAFKFLGAYNLGFTVGALTPEILKKSKIASAFVIFAALDFAKQRKYKAVIGCLSCWVGLNAGAEYNCTREILRIKWERGNLFAGLCLASSLVPNPILSLADKCTNRREMDILRGQIDGLLIEIGELKRERDELPVAFVQLQPPIDGMPS